jgi:hypothetical protein
MMPVNIEPIFAGFAAFLITWATKAYAASSVCDLFAIKKVAAHALFY